MSPYLWDFEDDVPDDGLGIMTRTGAHHQPRAVTPQRGPEIVCAPNYELRNGTCVPIAPLMPVDCPPGMTYDSANGGRCITTQNSCPDGTIDPGTGQCVRMPIDCPPETIYDNATQRCIRVAPVGPTQGDNNAGRLPGVSFQQPQISPDYIKKSIAKFGKPPLMPGAYTGNFPQQAWSPSPGGPGISDLACGCGGCSSGNNSSLLVWLLLGLGAYYFLSHR